MAKISLSYPDTWLTISISVKNRETWVEAFAGTMTEVGTTRTYIYDFTETTNVDYVYVATVSWYSSMSWTIYRDGGWLTTEQAERIDMKLSNVWSGLLYNNSYDYTKIDISLEKLKKEIQKEINAIEKIDLSEVTKKLEDLQKSIPKKDKAGEIVTITKLNQIEKKIDMQLEEEKKKKEDNDKETETVVWMFDKEQDRLEEIEDIVNSLNKEEIKYIIKLLK